MFFSSPILPYRLWSPPRLLFNRYRGPVSGVKRPARDVDNSHPSSTEIKNEWSYASTSPICLHGLDIDNFDFCVSKISVLWNVRFCHLLYRYRYFVECEILSFAI